MPKLSLKEVQKLFCNTNIFFSKGKYILHKYSWYLWVGKRMTPSFCFEKRKKIMMLAFEENHPITSRQIEALFAGQKKN